MMSRLALVLVVCPLVASPAAAACEGETYLNCPTEDGRQILACIGKDSFSYRFGPADTPELALSVPIEAAVVTPWPGIGGAIWSSLGFPNNGYVYEVWASVARNADEAAATGGVTVMQGDKTLASLTCAPGTARSAAFVLEDAMAARGYCFDFDKRSWFKGAGCAAP